MERSARKTRGVDDDSRADRVVRGAVPSAAEFEPRDAARRRPGALALLLEPAHGVSARYFQHRDQHGDASRALCPARDESARTLLRDARLEPADDPRDRPA